MVVHARAPLSPIGRPAGGRSDRPTAPPPAVHRQLRRHAAGRAERRGETASLPLPQGKQAPCRVSARSRRVQAGADDYRRVRARSAIRRAGRIRIVGGQVLRATRV